MLAWALIFDSVVVVYVYGLLLDVDARSAYVDLGYAFVLCATVALWIAIVIYLFPAGHYIGHP
jgi:hypothetical protein